MGAPPRTTRLTTKITTIPEATTTKTTTTPLTKTSTKSPRLSSKTPFKCLPLFVIAFLILLSSYKCDAKNANSILNFAKPQFSQWNENVTYVSTTRYNPRGMAPLYVGANMVVNMFFEKNPIPDGYIIVKERTIELGPKVENNDWSDLLKQYWGLLLVITLTALLVVLMPIIGLCFCCCRCAGACGGRSQPFDKKHDTCRRIFLGFLLIGAATGLLFGVVVAFVTNSYMQEGIEDVTTTAKDGMIDTKRYLDSTSSQINHLLVENYNELTQHLEDMLRTTADVVITKLEEKSKAISLKRLTDFVEHLPKMKEDLQRMKHITNELRVNASQLNDGLRGVKRELLVSLTKCSADSCKEILVKYEIGKLDANGIDYNQLPDVTEIIDSVSDLLSQKVIDNISKGKNVLNTMKQKLNETIDQNTPQVTNAINKAGKAIGSAAHEISGQIKTLSDIVGNNTDKGTRMADDYINAYSIYRFYLGIAISSLLLLVLVSVTLALFCGICGKRPGGYGDDCCNKGSGSRFLMLGVAVIFLTISILAIASLAHFLVGIIIQRGVCVPLRNTTDQVFNYIDEYIDLNHVLYPKNKRTKALISYANEYPPFRISHVIESCQQNHSIYEVMRLHNIFDIREVLEYPDKFKINETLQKLVDSIQLDLSDQILDDQAKENIRSLAKSKLENFEAHKFSQYLSDNITNQSLIVIADKLRETAERIPSSPDMTPIKTSLKNQALHLETYQEKLVKPMTDQSLEVLNLAENLETIIRPNGLSFEDYINSLLQEVTDAQDYINTNGTDFVKQVASELVGGFKNDIQSYLDLIVNSTQTYVGQCGPLANVYNALIVAGCNKVVDPFNGFWVGVGWCIIIFLPTLIISVKLSSLYQKSDPYPGPLVESEYLYDAYSERDNIPLANGPKNKRRKTKERRRGSRDRRGDYYEDSGSSHGTATGRDTRYTDMAPKHWDGGPPRYQNPPMAPPASEYERPPPYYYPGAQSDQD